MQPKEFHCTDKGGSNLVQRTSAWVVEVEKKEFSRAKTEDYFDESYFIEKLKIPKEYVKAFQFYIVEDSGYAEAIKAKNKTLARFRMGELAIKYLEMLEGK